MGRGARPAPARGEARECTWPGAPRDPRHRRAQSGETPREDVEGRRAGRVLTSPPATASPERNAQYGWREVPLGFRPDRSSGSSTFLRPRRGSDEPARPHRQRRSRDDPGGACPVQHAHSAIWGSRFESSCAHRLCRAGSNSRKLGRLPQVRSGPRRRRRRTDKLDFAGTGAGTERARNRKEGHLRSFRRAPIWRALLLVAILAVPAWGADRSSRPSRPRMPRCPPASASSP